MVGEEGGVSGRLFERCENGLWHGSRTVSERLWDGG